MTALREALHRAAQALAEAGSEEAALEAELLLAHALGTDRTHIYQRLPDDLPPAAAAAFEALLRRRLAHEPVPYITGRKEFYGLEFEVTPAAIIPRPETETLIELVLGFTGERGLATPRIADVGVGCGAIAVTLAVSLPQAEVIAVDISAEALALARRNAERHGVAARIDFREGDLLTPLAAHPEPKPGVSRDSSRTVDVIAANLPYVRTADFEAGPPEIREHEPRLGLDGGPDGLDLIRRLLRDAPSYLEAGGALFAEIGEEQGEAARALAVGCFPRAQIEIKQDLSGLDRVLVVRT
ncbi:MAG TPA: peptide chain release factor N(5)-glutamine methyltransferase [Dehalococcoidia bacterium]|nr:peptide chain release factor N(5)-glutamine methyltransferase [Dehalococcoidia bacterium]